jgi:hypothetical protein
MVCNVVPMSSDARTVSANAPVHSGEKGAETPGGATSSAPEPSPGLMERHRAALPLLKEASVEERWALLEAVVWPSDVLAEMQAEAA